VLVERVNPGDKKLCIVEGVGVGWGGKGGGGEGCA